MDLVPLLFNHSKSGFSLKCLSIRFAAIWLFRTASLHSNMCHYVQYVYLASLPNNMYLYTICIWHLCAAICTYTIYVFDIGLFREDLHLTENAICIVVGGTKRTARKEGWSGHKMPHGFHSEETICALQPFLSCLWNKRYNQCNQWPTVGFFQYRLWFGVEDKSWVALLDWVKATHSMPGSILPFALFWN